MHFTRICLFFLFTLLTQYDLLAQGTIKGRITTAEDGSSLPGANIILKNTTMGASSGADGTYNISRIPDGIYIIRVSFIGYKTVVTPEIVVSGDSVITLDFRLKEALTPLKEVVVTPGHYSILKSQPESKLSLSKENVKEIALFGGDIYHAVQRLPGVTGNDFSAKFTVRGGENNEILGFFNGTELYTPFHQQDAGGIISIIDVETVGSIDLITGSFPAEYGGKKSGVLNIHPDLSPLASPVMTAGLSFMNGRLMAAGPIKNNAGKWMFSARRGFADVAVRISGDAERVLPRYYDMYGMASYNLSPNHSLSLNVLRSGDELTFDENDIRDFESGYESTYSWINMRSAFTEKLYSQTVLSVGALNKHRRGIYAPSSGFVQDEVDERRVFNFTTVRQDWEISLTNALLMKWGFEYKDVDTELDYHVIGSNTVNNRNISGFIADGKDFGFYISQRYRPAAFLTLEAGIRYDEQTYIPDNTTSPRLNLSFSPSKNTALKFGWGKFYQPQQINEIEPIERVIDFSDSYLLTSQELTYYKAEEAEHRVIGFESTITNGIHFRAEAYKKLLSNFRPRYINKQHPLNLLPETLDDRVIYEPSEGNAEGIEVMLKKDVGSPISWWLNYVYSVAEDHFDASGAFAAFGSSTPVTVLKPFDQTHALDFNLNYKPGERWQFNSSWVYHSGFPKTEFTVENNRFVPGTYNASRFPAYHRLDLRVTRNFIGEKNSFGVFLEIINAYNRKNLHFVEHSKGFDSATRPILISKEHYFLRFLPSLGISWKR